MTIHQSLYGVQAVNDPKISPKSENKEAWWGTDPHVGPVGTSYRSKNICGLRRPILVQKWPHIFIRDKNVPSPFSQFPLPGSRGCVVVPKNPVALFFKIAPPLRKSLLVAYRTSLLSTICQRSSSPCLINRIHGQGKPISL
jgi:hypothetical protein